MRNGDFSSGVVRLDEVRQGFAYSGGFFLRSPGACLPLTFRVGQRSATVRFGLGRRCG
jgi:hypothetical protein